MLRRLNISSLFLSLTLVHTQTHEKKERYEGKEEGRLGGDEQREA